MQSHETSPHRYGGHGANVSKKEQRSRAPATIAAQPFQGKLATKTTLRQREKARRQIIAAYRKKLPGIKLADFLNKDFFVNALLREGLVTAVPRSSVLQILHHLEGKGKIPPFDSLEKRQDAVRSQQRQRVKAMAQRVRAARRPLKP